jgi:hypothetical protein
MEREQIIAVLVQERDKLNAAIEALAGHDGPFPMKPGPAKKRHVSAAARKRMAEGQRKRWAALKGTK